MVDLPKDRLFDLRSKIKTQRNTVESLKREGHVFADAERHLSELQRELREAEAASPVARDGSVWSDNG